MLQIKDSDDNQALTTFIRQYIHPFFTLKDLEWEYNTYFGTPVKKVLTDESGKIFGTCGHMPIPLVYKGAVTQSIKSESGYFLPETRGTGLFEKLYSEGVTDSFSMGAECVWGFTALTRLWKKKLAFFVWDGIMMHSVINLSAIKKMRRCLVEKNTSVFKRFGKAAYYLLKGKYGAFGISGKSALQLNISECKSWSLNCKKIISGNDRTQPYYYLDYNEQFVSWRFIENPRCRYELIEITKNGECIACIAANVTSADKVILTECIIGHLAAIDEVFQLILNHYRSNGFVELEWHGNSTNNDIRRIINAMKKFRAKVGENKYIGFIFDNKCHQEISIQEWYITGSWTEGFRI